MHVKICGITSLEDALAAARHGADFVGLIRAPSVRRVALDVARQVVRSLPSTTRAVLVFRDAPLDEVVAALAAADCAWVQLHGCETPAYVGELQRQRPGVRIIKAWEISSSHDGAELCGYLRTAADAGVHVDVVLLDVPKGGPHPGMECLGEVSRRLDARPPAVWCAGGLGPASVAATLAAGRYDGADVAGGVEIRPGVKDHDLIRQFVAAARRGG